MAAFGTCEVGAAAAALRSVPRVPPRPRSARVTEDAPVEFGETLRRQCTELASAFAGANGITLTCTAAPAKLSQAMATDLAMVALGLIGSASTSFPDRRHGRIGVSFRVDVAELELAVEYSGPGTPTARSQAVEASKLEQRLVARLGGRIDCPRMIGGVRMVVSVPRP